MKIKIEEYTGFELNYFRRVSLKQTSERFGQAFLNKFSQFSPCPEIYYDTDFWTVKGKIFERFVDV